MSLLRIIRGVVGIICICFALFLALPRMASGALVNMASYHLLRVYLGKPAYNLAAIRQIYAQALEWDRQSAGANRGLVSVDAFAGRVTVTGNLPVSQMRDSVLLLGRGERLLENGQIHAAEGHFRQALALESLLCVAYFDLAELYYSQGDWPNLLRTLYQLEANGFWSEQETLFDRDTGITLDCLEFGRQDPGSPRRQQFQDDLWGNYWVGQLHRLDGNYSKAMKAFSRVISRDTTFPYAQLSLGEALYMQGRYEQAIPVLESAAKRDPDLFWPLLYLGRCYVAVGKAGKAKPFLERARALDPCYLPVRRAWGHNVWWSVPGSIERENSKPGQVGCVANADELLKK